MRSASERARSRIASSGASSRAAAARQSGGPAYRSSESGSRSASASPNRTNVSAASSKLAAAGGRDPQAAPTVIVATHNQQRRFTRPRLACGVEFPIRRPQSRERFDDIADDPFAMLKMARYGISFNLDGIWGGHMYAGGAGAILPNKITSKHNMRYVPNMNGLEMVKKIRAQLDRNGYKDVELKIIGDVPWSKMSYDSDVARAVEQMFDTFHISYATPSPHESILAGGYWPSYLFSNGEVGQRVAPVKMPIAGGAAGMGGNAHAANEFYVIEGAGKVYGMAGAEKSIATIIYNFAGKNGPAPKPRPTN